MTLFVFILSFVSVYFTMWTEPDIYWRLTEARWMIEHKAVIHENIFSWDQYERISHSWLFDVIIGVLYNIHPLAVVLFMSSLFAFLFYLCTRGYTIHQKAAAAALFSMMFFQVGVRASVISSIAIVLLAKYSFKWWQYILAGVLLGNLHGGFVPIVVFFALILSHKHKSHLYGSAILLLTSFLNPYGYKAVFYSLYAFPQYFMMLNIEFQSPMTNTRSVAGLALAFLTVIAVQYFRFSGETLVAIALWLFSVRFMTIMYPLIILDLKKVNIGKYVGFACVSFVTLLVSLISTSAVSTSKYPFPVPEGRVLTHLNLGSYVMFKEQKSFVDTRWDPFSAKTFDTFIDLLRGINIRKHLEETKPEYVIWVSDTPMSSWLKEHGAKIVYSNKGVDIFDLRDFTGIQRGRKHKTNTG